MSGQVVLNAGVSTCTRILRAITPWIIFSVPFEFNNGYVIARVHLGVVEPPKVPPLVIYVFLLELTCYVESACFCIYASHLSVQFLYHCVSVLLYLIVTVHFIISLIMSLRVK